MSFPPNGRRQLALGAKRRPARRKRSSRRARHYLFNLKPRQSQSGFARKTGRISRSPATPSVNSLFFEQDFPRKDAKKSKNLNLELKNSGKSGNLGLPFPEFHIDSMP
jgi:hypothetical protein